VRKPLPAGSRWGRSPFLAGVFLLVAYSLHRHSPCKLKVVRVSLQIASHIAPRHPMPWYARRLRSESWPRGRRCSPA